MFEFIKKNKVTFIVLSLILIFIIILIIVGGVGAEKGNDKEKNNNNTKSEDIVVESEFDMTEEEQMKDEVYKYLNYRGTYIYDYNSLSKYPKVYQDTLVMFYMYVVKVVEENDDEYKILVGYSSALNSPVEEDKLLMLEGKYVNGERYAMGSQYLIYGIFKGIETYKVDGSTQVVPKIKVDKYLEEDSESGIREIYNRDDIRKVAKSFFNDNQLSVDDPTYNPNFEYYPDQSPFYFITLESNNNKFRQFRFYSYIGDIEPVTENDNTLIVQKIAKTKDNGDYLLLTYSPTTIHLDLQRYDKDFKLIWTREFENIDNYRWDVNNGRIALYMNNELYYIDEDGKDLLDNSIMVPNCLKLKLLMNGDVILVSDTATNFINYIDSTGKLLWRQNNNYEPAEIYKITVANDRIYVNHRLKSDDYDLNAYITVFTKTGEREMTTKR